MTKNSGCAFKIVDTDGVRYYTSREIAGLADFARSLHGKARDGGGSPLPLVERIAGAVECSEEAWLAMADDMEAEKKFSCFLIVDIVENILWVNEDRGEGLALYMFQLSEVLKAVAVERDIWDFLLSRFPYARIDR